jgi:Tfp pilus assembly protein PilV
VDVDDDAEHEVLIGALVITVVILTLVVMLLAVLR